MHLHSKHYFQFCSFGGTCFQLPVVQEVQEGVGGMASTQSKKVLEISAETLAYLIFGQIIVSTESHKWEMKVGC